MLTAVRNSNGIRRPEEVLGDWVDSPAIANSDWPVISVQVGAVAGLLVVLEALH